MCSSVHKSANIHFIMNRGCGNIARTNLINRLLFYALYGDKIIASEGYLRVYSNRDDLGACSNNLLYIRSGIIYPVGDFFGKFCSEILNLNENPKEIYIPLYSFFENFENFAFFTCIYSGIYAGKPLYGSFSEP